MLRIGIVGATGYAGRELIKILLRHPNVKITSVSAKVDKPELISDIFPVFRSRLDLMCCEPDLREIEQSTDLIFLALPHKISMNFVPKFLDMGKKVVDLSADYRLTEKSTYEAWYGVKHSSPELLTTKVYGLPELYKKDIAQARLVANPGCYPTASILGCLPLVQEGLVETDQIIIDAKSGTTGAGRTPSMALLFSEANENFRAYKINQHPHMPEINQELSKRAKSKIEITFVPHIIPMSQGILATIYFNLKPARPFGRSGGKESVTKDLITRYKAYYKNQPFVRVLPEGIFPETRNVTGTNFCDIGIKVMGKKAIVISAIDNLWKGAASQAVQNMNIMEGFTETLGLL
ncbi:MAG: N-acetyl-gamma-glutamyl-phosphate reductase [Planctomycetota bacterium]